MNIAHVARVTMALVAVVGGAWGQVKAPAREQGAKSGRSTGDAPVEALLTKVEIVKAADGTLRCLGRASGAACTEDERQAATTVIKSRSNVKNNLVIANDGLLTCTIAATGRPCSAAETEEAVTQSALASGPVRQVGVGLGKPSAGGMEGPAPSGSTGKPAAGPAGKGK